MRLLTIIGRLLILAAIGMTIAKYVFGVEAIEGWGLYPLIVGFLLTGIGAAKSRKVENG